jgi:hypothetical protein
LTGSSDGEIAAGEHLLTVPVLLRWSAVFAVLLAVGHETVVAVRRHVVFDGPPHWPLSIYNPRGPHGVIEYAAMAASVALGAWALRALPRKGWPLPLVTVVGVGLILLTNAIQGVPKGFVNPIVGGVAPEQYYHDARHVSDPQAFLRDFATIQPTLHTHAKTHPAGAVLLFYALRKLTGDRPAGVSILLALLATALSAPGMYVLCRRLVWVDSATAGFATQLYLCLPAVQIYYCATLDALVGALLLAALAAWVCVPTPRNTALTALGILAASFLTFGFVWALPVLITVDAVRGRWSRWLWVVAALVAFYAAVKLGTGFDYLLASRTASLSENPHGFRLFSEPISYAFTRVEDVSEILVFFGPVLIGLLIRGLGLLRGAADHRPAYAVVGVGVGTLLLLFLTGAYHTGETARACIFLYPALLLPAVRTLQGGSERDRRMTLALVLGQAIAMQSFGNFFW